MSKKYQIDRRVLAGNINIADSVEMLQQMKEGIIKGGEFIITAEDILNKQAIIPGIHLVGFNPATFPAFVESKDCEIVYIQNKDD